MRARELRRVVDEVGQHLRQPHGVAVQVDRLLAAVPPCSSWSRAATRGRAGLHGALDQCRQAELLGLDHHLALHDARDVQQVVDEPRHVIGLPADHIAGPVHRGLRDVVALHDVHGVADRRQRVAQLVGQHRQELVLAPVGLLHGRVQPRVLHGDRGAADDFLGQRDPRRIHAAPRAPAGSAPRGPGRPPAAGRWRPPGRPRARVELLALRAPASSAARRPCGMASGAVVRRRGMALDARQRCRPRSPAPARPGRPAWAPPRRTAPLMVSSMFSERDSSWLASAR